MSKNISVSASSSSQYVLAMSKSDLASLYSSILNKWDNGRKYRYFYIDITNMSGSPNEISLKGRIDEYDSYWDIASCGKSGNYLFYNGNMYNTYKFYMTPYTSVGNSYIYFYNFPQINSHTIMSGSSYSEADYFSIYSGGSLYIYNSSGGHSVEGMYVYIYSPNSSCSFKLNFNLCDKL